MRMGPEVCSETLLRNCHNSLRNDPEERTGVLILDDGTICSEMSARNCHNSMRNDPEECSFQPLRGGSLKPRVFKCGLTQQIVKFSLSLRTFQLCDVSAGEPTFGNQNCSSAVYRDLFLNHATSNLRRPRAVGTVSTSHCQQRTSFAGSPW